MKDLNQNKRQYDYWVRANEDKVISIMCGVIGTVLFVALLATGVTIN